MISSMSFERTSFVQCFVDDSGLLLFPVEFVKIGFIIVYFQEEELNLHLSSSVDDKKISFRLNFGVHINYFSKLEAF